MPRKTYLSTSPRLRSHRHRSRPHLQEKEPPSGRPRAAWTRASPGARTLQPLHTSSHTRVPSGAGGMDRQPLRPETGPAPATPPPLQRGEAASLRKLLAAGLGQGMGKTLGTISVLTLKCLNCNRWDQTVVYRTAGATSQHPCKTPTAESLLRGETRLHELPLHLSD